LFSDHSPIIFTINIKIIIKVNHVLSATPKENGPENFQLLRTILDNSIPLRSDDDVICVVESFSCTVQWAGM